MWESRLRLARFPSVNTSKPATHDHFKTGHLNLTADGDFLLPCHPHSGNQKCSMADRHAVHELLFHFGTSSSARMADDDIWSGWAPSGTQATTTGDLRDSLAAMA